MREISPEELQEMTPEELLAFLEEVEEEIEELSQDPRANADALVRLMDVAEAVEHVKKGLRDMGELP